MTHAVKIEPRFYRMVINGLKPYEIRFNDRDYRVGDYLALNEWDAEKKEYTHKTALFEIVSVLNNEDFPDGINPGYVVLGLSRRYISGETQIQFHHNYFHKG